MISFATTVEVALIVFVAAALQRAIGFGFALLAVPLMAFVVPTKSAVVIVFLTGSVTSVWLALRLVHRIEWRTARRLGAGAVVGAPVGVVILSLVSAMSLRLVLGVTTSAAAVWIIVSSRRGSARPVEHKRSTTFGLGVASGVLNTSLATSGPPLVYELRRTGFHGDRFRGTISAVFVISNLIGLPLLALAGLITATDLALAVISVLPCVAGFLFGSRIARRMSPARFAWAVDALLLATGLVTIVKVL
ncbi:MAG: sulfite exporter TauE/SafE family protein [Acidimicrobiales bacterium]